MFKIIVTDYDVKIFLPDVININCDAVSYRGNRSGKGTGKSLKML